MKLICWHKSMDQLWSDTWKAFQSTVDEPLFFVLQSYSDPYRKKYGWKPEDLAEFQLTMLSQKSWWSKGKEIIDSNPKAIHVFFGFWGSRKFFPLILYASWRGVKVAVINETYSTNLTGYYEEEPLIISWFKVKVRPLLYRIAAILLKVVSKGRSPCILAISLLAQEQFLQAGFDRNSVFPFGYFIGRRPVNLVSKKDVKDGFRWIFVGALLKRKGVDIAVEAVERLNRCGIKVLLDVYGPGKPELFISSNSVCVRYRGLLAQEDVQIVMAQYDGLILPSRHDGWGVVVNESLLQGIPVIVSDHVGSKCLVETTLSGVVFKSEDVADLAANLELLVLEPARLEKLREKALEAGNHILPEIAAQYMLDVFNFYFYDKQSSKRPNAIWCGEANL